MIICGSVFFDSKTTLAYYWGQTYKFDSQKIIACNNYDFVKEYSKVEEFDIIAIHRDDQQIDNILKIKEIVAKTIVIMLKNIESALFRY